VRTSSTTIEPQTFSVAQAADYLGVSRSKAYEMCSLGGELPTVRLGRTVRVPRRHLEEWLDRQVTATLSPPMPHR